MSSELNIGKVNHFHKADKLSDISFVSWKMKTGTRDKGQETRSEKLKDKN
jgi:hypothetical protein